MAVTGYRGKPTGLSGLQSGLRPGLQTLVGQAVSTLLGRARKLSLNFLSGQLDPRITFTRADATSCATFFDSTGLLQTAAANIPRFDYDPVTLRPRGLLIEESRTNLLTQSTSQVVSPWAIVGAPSAVSAPSPDGGSGAVTFTSTGALVGYYQFVAVTAGTTYTFSRYVKKVSGVGVTARVGSDSALFGVATSALTDFNLDTLTFQGTTAGVTATGFQSIGNGWYRIWCVASCTTTGSAAALSYNSIAGSVSHWYPQVEVGAFPTSCIPTVATTVTRAADNAVMTGTNFSSWYSQTQGTFIAEGDTAGINGASTLLDANDNTFNNRMQLRFQASSFAGNVVTAGGVVQTSPSGDSGAVYAGEKLGLSYSTAGASFAHFGRAPITAGALTLPTVNQLRIGAVADGSQERLNGHIRRITYYNTRLSDAQLQAQTV